LQGRFTWIIVIVAGLLAVVALGLVLRCQTPPSTADVVLEVPEGEPQPTRIAPAAPTPVPKGTATTTESGLRVYDFKQGTGATPTQGQTVVVDYTGWLMTGKKFDSSLDRDEPIAFPLGTGRVIAGWDEGLSTMKVGGHRQLVIPPELAYGESGREPVIPPNSTLVFEVHLVDVK
jgi:peptidylprolyl isomerase